MKAGEISVYGESALNSLLFMYFFFPEPLRTFMRFAPLATPFLLYSPSVLTRCCNQRNSLPHVFFVPCQFGRRSESFWAFYKIRLLAPTSQSRLADNPTNCIRGILDCTTKVLSPHFDRILESARCLVHSTISLKRAGPSSSRRILAGLSVCAERNECFSAKRRCVLVIAK